MQHFLETDFSDHIVIATKPAAIVSMAVRQVVTMHQIVANMAYHLQITSSACSNSEELVFVVLQIGDPRIFGNREGLFEGNRFPHFLQSGGLSIVRKAQQVENQTRRRPLEGVSLALRMRQRTKSHIANSVQKGSQSVFHRFDLF